VAAVVAGVVALGVVPALLASDGAEGAVVSPGAGLATNYDFARLVLRDGGWPVSVNNVTVLTQWLRAEEPPTHWWDRDNPLNNGLGSGGGSGLGSYGSVVTAAYDVARNLENPAYGYPLVARDLRASALPGSTARAIWRSSWAGGHYGWGADWATTPVPSVTAPPTAWRSPTACPIAYSAGVVGPCGAGFSAAGPSWRSGAPGGVEGQELWAFATRGSTDTATWHAAVAPGRYAVSAFLPRLFDDAVATYEVHDADGVQPVRVDQEPYSNAWAPLGEFEAGHGGLTVTLGTHAGPGRSLTYVAADALRFAPVAAGAGGGESHAAGGGAGRPRGLAAPPQAPQAVTAVAGAGDAVVSFLAPSKDGGAPLQGFLVEARPGHASCRAGVRLSGAEACTVAGLQDGVPYRFVVRALNRYGEGAGATSGPAVPLALPSLTVAVQGHVAVGSRVVLRARVAPAPRSGVVLFAEDGRAMTGCESARVVHGRASCATRLEAAGRASFLVSFSGGGALAGAQVATAVRAPRVTTRLLAAASPPQVAAGGTVTLRAWGLPGRATGRVVFSTGPRRLCVGTATGGGATCAARATLTVGRHLVVATYVGDRDDRRAVARTTLEVLAPAP
jgi:hypothetical protein